MARDLGVLADAGILLGSTNGLLLLCMIIMSLSIISMVIFVCGDFDDSHHGGGGGGGGGVDGVVEVAVVEVAVVDRKMKNSLLLL